jgi:transposase
MRLTPTERQTLLAWQRSSLTPVGLARRSRVLLLLADGLTITEIAAVVGLSRRHTYKWIQRFMQAGLEALSNKRGRGRREPLPSQLREQANSREVGFP